jgi:FkbM family methyltransferase
VDRFVVSAEKLVAGLGAPAEALETLRKREMDQAELKANRFDTRRVLCDATWFHSFVLSDGTLVDGAKTPAILQAEFETILAPLSLDGLSVLDIGAWNGAYSFEAKRRGAARVLATDMFAWTHPRFRGLEKFLYVRKDSGLDVEYNLIDVPDITTETVGQFDVVLFLGVFYHLPDPLSAVKNLAEIAKRWLVLETHLDLDEVPYPAMRYYPDRELQDDPTNWWGPNRKCIEALLENAGFSQIRFTPYPTGRRGIFHARKADDLSGIDTTHQPLSARVAKRLRAVGQRLSGQGSASPMPGAEAAPAASQLQPAPRAEHPLDATAAEVLADGSLIFSPEDPTRLDAWWVFARGASEREEIPAVFALRGAIPAFLSSEAFVCGAYRAVLAREADHVGQGGFTALLEAGKTTRPGFLRTLVTSPEASIRYDQFVLVPQPSRWLPSTIARPEAAEHIAVLHWRPTLAARSGHSHLQLYTGYADADLALFEEFRDPAARAQPGFVVDFLGGRIRVSSLWPSARIYDGQLQGPPVPADYQAEAVEWIGLLKSVKTAGTQYVAMELGAGFGQWSVAGGLAGRRRGIADIRLCAVEADPQHFRSLRQNFVDNGFDPDSHTLIEAAVGIAAGEARWPALDDSSGDWGARPIIADGGQGQPAQDHRGMTFAATIAVKIVPIGELIRREPRWDLVHIDVQGTEFDLVRSALDELNQRVHWLVMGTHSRKIEGELIELLAGAGWLLEHEKPAKFVFQPEAATLEAMTILDGTQVWRNPRCGAA